MLLAGHEGIVTSDRWWGYNHLPLERRQICWSHLRAETSRRTPKGSLRRRSSASMAWLYASASSGPGRSSRTPTTARR
jgi:hypothetical protein